MWPVWERMGSRCTVAQSEWCERGGWKRGWQMGDTDWVKGQLAPSLPRSRENRLKRTGPFLHKRPFRRSHMSCSSTHVLFWIQKNNAGVCHKVGQRRSNNVVCLRCWQGQLVDGVCVCVCVCVLIVLTCIRPDNRYHPPCSLPDTSSYSLSSLLYYDSCRASCRRFTPKTSKICMSWPQ